MNPDLELFDANPDWRPLLAAYHERQAASETGWLARIAAVDGLAVEQTSMVHGKLIALGLLKIDMGTRTEGVRYQVTPLGRQAVVPPQSRQQIHEWQQVEETDAAAA